MPFLAKLAKHLSKEEDGTKVQNDEIQTQCWV